MQTAWSGYGLPASNMVWTDVFVPWSCAVVLSDTPQVVTRVQLPTLTHGVSLWTPADQVWYGLADLAGHTPGPVVPPVTGTVVPAAAFTFGGILWPGIWQLFALPDDSLQHELLLVSAAPSPTVWLTALREE